MQLRLRRKAEPQLDRKGVRTGTKYELHWRLELTPDETALSDQFVEPGEYIVFTERNKVTLSQLLTGGVQSGDAETLLKWEAIYTNWCQAYAAKLFARSQFTGEKLVSIVPDGAIRDDESQ